MPRSIYYTLWGLLSSQQNSYNWTNAEFRIIWYSRVFARLRELLSILNTLQEAYNNGIGIPVCNNR